jgi:hypothetical protein
VPSLAVDTSGRPRDGLQTRPWDGAFAIDANAVGSAIEAGQRFGDLSATLIPRIDKFEGELIASLLRVFIAHHRAYIRAAFSSFTERGPGPGDALLAETQQSAPGGFCPFFAFLHYAYLLLSENTYR